MRLDHAKQKPKTMLREDDRAKKMGILFLSRDSTKVSCGITVHSNLKRKKKKRKKKVVVSLSLKQHFHS